MYKWRSWHHPGVGEVGGGVCGWGCRCGGVCGWGVDVEGCVLRKDKEVCMWKGRSQQSQSKVIQVVLWSAPCTYAAAASIVARVWAAVVDVGLAVGASVPSNTCAPVPTRAVISAGCSILAGTAALTGEEVCACVRECVHVWEETRGTRSETKFSSVIETVFPPNPQNVTREYCLCERRSSPTSQRAPEYPLRQMHSFGRLQ